MTDYCISHILVVVIASQLLEAPLYDKKHGTERSVQKSEAPKPVCACLLFLVEKPITEPRFH